MEESFYSQVLRKNAIPILLGAGGLIFVVIGLFSVFSRSTSPNQLEFKAGSSSSAGESLASGTQTKIIVDIEGGVMKPGIYELSQSSRIHDLIVVSGGLSASADRDWFAKNLNQAAKLSDGQKVYIPREGEQIMTAASTSVSGGSSTDALISINSASLKDLDTLPGVGPVTAQKIVDNRPYSSINDILSKKVVSSSVFEKIKDKISAN